MLRHTNCTSVPQTAQACREQFAAVWNAEFARGTFDPAYLKLAAIKLAYLNAKLAAITASTQGAN